MAIRTGMFSAILAALILAPGMPGGPDAARAAPPDAPEPAAGDAACPAAPFPLNISMTHRVMLTIGKTVVSLNGLMAVGPRGEIRLTILHDMGQILADLIVTADGDAIAARESAALPARLIRRHVAADVVRMFFPARAAGPGELRCECEPQTGIPATAAKSGRGAFEVKYAEHKTFDGIPGPVPTRISLKTERRALELRIISLAPLKNIPDNLFNIPDN